MFRVEVEDNRKRNEAERKEGYQHEDADVNRKTANPWDKATVGTLDGRLINFATAGEAVTTTENDDKAEDESREKQSCVALYQERFRYLIKILIHAWF